MLFDAVKKLDIFFEWVIKILTGLATALLVPMMFLVTGDVIGRYLLKMPIPAVFEINSNFLMVLVVFFPLAYVHRRKEHVFVTIFTERFPSRAKAVLEILSIVFGLFAFGLIGWYGLEAAIAATMVKEYIPGIITVPVWLSKWIIPIGTAVFCIELIRDGITHIKMMRHPTSR
jgi:TRAP-type C4-dicarboxylate transport system permease small subunit